MKTNTFLTEALLALQQEGTLLYPTDTIWGIGGDARSTTVVEKVYALKQRADSKALICLVANQSMLEAYVGDSPQPITLQKGNALLRSFTLK